MSHEHKGGPRLRSSRPWPGVGQRGLPEGEDRGHPRRSSHSLPRTSWARWRWCYLPPV